MALKPPKRKITLMTLLKPRLEMRAKQDATALALPPSHTCVHILASRVWSYQRPRNNTRFLKRPGVQDEDASRGMSQTAGENRGCLSLNSRASFQATMLQTVCGSEDVGSRVGKSLPCQSIQSILGGDEAAMCRGHAGTLSLPLCLGAGGGWHQRFWCHRR